MKDILKQWHMLRKVKGLVTQLNNFYNMNATEYLAQYGKINSVTAHAADLTKKLSDATGQLIEEIEDRLEAVREGAEGDGESGT